MRSLLIAFCTIVGATLVAGCAAEHAAEFPPMELRAPDQLLGSASREVIAGAPDDHLEIASVSEAVLDGATFLIADLRGHRIFRLDTTFALIRAFGSEGAGPGELMRPSMVVPWNDVLVVGEFTNGRFSIFDRGGSYLRTVPGGAHPDWHGVLHDGRIVRRSSSLDHYGVVISPDGSSAPFAPRPASLIAAPGTTTLGGDGALILVARGDTTHVLDNEFGVLLKYDGDGRLLLGRSLPGEVLHPLREYRDKVVGAFARQGRRVVGLTLLHTMSFADDGTILIRIGHGNAAALRVDPSDYSARRIVGDMADPAMALVAHASSALILGDTYYTFADAGIAAHPLLRSSQ